MINTMNIIYKYISIYDKYDKYDMIYIYIITMINNTHIYMINMIYIYIYRCINTYKYL